jgi:hypothetical protein
MDFHDCGRILNTSGNQACSIFMREVLMKSIRVSLWLACTLLVCRIGFALDATPPAGTAVSVTLIDSIDSNADSAGKQYEAVLIAPIALPDGKTIPAGARATVSLVHNNSGWLTQLTAVTQNGHTVPVLSGGGTVIVPAQKNKPQTDPTLLSRLAPQNTAPPAGRIRLASSTQLRFFLVRTAVPIPTPSPVRRRNTSVGRSSKSGTLPAESGAAPTRSRGLPRQASGISYLCRASESSERTPNSYYVADVLRTSDSPAVVERSWHAYLLATYPYRFANNPHASFQCARLDDAAALSRLQGEMNAGNAEIVRTRWRYTLGPPPADTTANPRLP